MRTDPPANIGAPLATVNTPALIIELDAFEHNLRKMADELRRLDVRFRPHAKTHKCPEIALLQIDQGAVGTCCQTLHEAECLVEGGVQDVLVSNQVVGDNKIDRLARLTRRAKIGVCVDDADNVRELGLAASRADSELRVLVEIDVGMGRCGVVPGESARDLAELVDRTEHLKFEGIQAYHGRAQHIRDYVERQAAIEHATALAEETIVSLRERGLACETVAGAGTGTYPFEAASGIYNELQPGSYIFMDADYGRNRLQDGSDFDTFEHSLFVLSTVISTQLEGRVIIDAGLKAHSIDSGLPTVAGFPDVPYIGPSDEHGSLDLSQSDQRFSVGDRVRLIPGHCDPTVNLYDWFIGVRNDRVEACWPITARGPGR